MRTLAYMPNRNNPSTEMKIAWVIADNMRDICPIKISMKKGKKGNISRATIKVPRNKSRPTNTSDAIISLRKSQKPRKRTEGEIHSKYRREITSKYWKVNEVNLKNPSLRPNETSRTLLKLTNLRCGYLGSRRERGSSGAHSRFHLHQPWAPSHPESIPEKKGAPRNQQTEGHTWK